MDPIRHENHLPIALGPDRALASLSETFSQLGFMPHGHCYLWKPALVWTHVVSDLLIGFAYVSISLILYALVKKIQLQFSAVVLCFGLFIGACGATHFMEVWNLWNADYWWGAWVKVVTAAASVGTGIYFYQLRHPIVTVAEAAKLSEQRRLDLEALTGNLERRIQERTEELAKTSKQLQIITDALPVLITYVNNREHCLFVSKTFERWFGKEAGETTGKTVRELVGEENYRKFGPHIQRALSGHEVTYETEISVPSGEKINIHTTYIPDKDSTGTVLGYVALIEDITGRIRFERELAQAIRARDEFISVASHELKTPVTSLKLQNQLLARTAARATGPLEPERIQKATNISNQQLDRLVTLIDDMLDISRISTGRFTIQQDTVDLGRLIAEISQRYSQLAKEEGSTLSVEVDDEIVGQWDPLRVQQILENLLSNAIKYGEKRPIRIWARKVGGNAVFAVKDEGIGIAPENHERIFRRFERAVSASHISGLGLGLYIVHQIVKLHLGKIELKSEPGQGSEFIVTLPLNPASDSAAGESTIGGSGTA